MCHTDCIVLSRITRHLSLLLHFFFFNDTATTEIYTLSLHDALPISQPVRKNHLHRPGRRLYGHRADRRDGNQDRTDRKSTRLNSSHLVISYAVFCLKKKTMFTSSARNRIGKTAATIATRMPVTMVAL